MREVNFKNLEHSNGEPSALSVGFCLGVMVSLYTFMLVVFWKLWR